jgi:hypothetical protein
MDRPQKITFRDGRRWLAQRLDLLHRLQVQPLLAMLIDARMSCGRR